VTSEQNYIKKKSDIQPRLISAGLLLGLLPWNRVQNMFFVLLILLLVIKHKDFSHKSKAIFSSLCIITLLIPLLFLLHNNALNSWWEQIILTPRKLLQTQDTMVAMSFQQFMTTLIKFVIFSFVLTILLFVYSRLNKVTRERSLKFLVDALVLLTMTFLGIFSISRDVNPNLDNALSNWIIIVGQWLPFSIWHLVVILTIIICVYIFLTIPLKIIRNQLRSSEFQLSFELQVLMATSISCIIFLYPNVGNLWAVSLPIGIFVIRYFEHLGFSIFTQRAVRTRYDFFEKSLQRILCMTSISGLLLLPFANSNMNLDFKNPDLKFLKTNNSRSVDVNDALFQLGSRIVDGAGSVYFHCPYGLASMPGDEYLPNSENWGDIVYTIPNRKNELVFARYLVVCWDSYEVKSFSIPSSFVKIDDVVKNGSKIASLYSQSK
jgi:hypothetical protein